ncbi:MAG: hypothetical protein RLZZ26_120 [Candidatus Parcubacteria bacterium]|jgi:orotate phosphoribosyltransferase
MKKSVIPREGESLMDLGKRCNAVYICRKVDSVRKGKLVVYAGKDAKGRNLVGDIYFNFRRIEEHPHVVEAFAETACRRLETRGLLDTFDTVIGIPEGGRTFGQMVALVGGKRFTYATKKPKPTEAGRKQEYEWDLSQFEFEPGERVAIAEDVFNNLQNTDTNLVELAATGVEVVLLVGALNRSPVYDSYYTPRIGAYAGKELPIVAAIRQAYPEYEQGDPEVAADIAAGRLELEVKRHWGQLCASM